MHMNHFFFQRKSSQDIRRSSSRLHLNWKNMLVKNQTLDCISNKFPVISSLPSHRQRSFNKWAEQRSHWHFNEHPHRPSEQQLRHGLRCPPATSMCLVPFPAPLWSSSLPTHSGRQWTVAQVLGFLPRIRETQLQNSGLLGSTWPSLNFCWCYKEWINSCKISLSYTKLRLKCW